jgi:peroxiredoxin
MSTSRILFLFMASTLFAQQRTQAGESPFQTISPVISDTLTFRAQLADFEATDLSRRTWRLSDLRGKLTVVSIWSTWCLPCRQEHAELQRFCDQTKRTKDIQVLTFSLDTDPAVTWSYMNEKGYTFPVIVNRQLEERLFSVDGGIPKTWVIDREGRKSEPFRSWRLGRILIEAEKEAKRN